MPIRCARSESRRSEALPTPVLGFRSSSQRLIKRVETLRTEVQRPEVQLFWMITSDILDDIFEQFSEHRLSESGVSCPKIAIAIEAGPR